MWKKILISGAVGAAILGAGGTALAASGSSSSTPLGAASAGPSTQSGHAKAKGKAGAELRHALQGTWVTKGKDGTFVTHDAIRGTVTAVGPGSITVQAADNEPPETYGVTPSTKVHVKGDKTPAAIDGVHKGDAVGILGTGTSTLTATHILDRGAASATSSKS